MSRLIILLGIPGSGKSSIAKYLQSEFQEYKIISTDAIRAKLFGNEAIQGPWLKIWNEVEQQLQEAIITTNTVIYDATNISRKQRKEIIALARSKGFTEIIGLWVNTKLEICLKRNQQRHRQVPEAIILNMYQQLREVPPSYEEGFDRLLYYQNNATSTEISSQSMRKNRTEPNF